MKNYIDFKLQEEDVSWDYNGTRKFLILKELMEARDECKAEGDLENMNKYQELITNYTLGRIS